MMASEGSNLPPLPQIPGGPAAGPEVIISERRLHPATFFFSLLAVTQALILPLIFLASLKFKANAFVFMAIISAIPVLKAFERFFTLKYRLDTRELATRHGILEKNERHIPLERIQDVRLEEGVLHRLFKVVDVHIETAGGQGAEASLSVLSKADAEMLRSAIIAAKGNLQPAKLTDAKPQEVSVLHEVSLRDLIIGGLTSNQVMSILVLIFAGWALVDDLLPAAVVVQWEERVNSIVQSLFQDGPGYTTLAIVILMLLAAGTILSVIGSIVLFYGFRLSLAGEDVHRRYGLITRRSSSLPRRRIQLLKIEEGLLRRVGGYATLRADTAGGLGADQRSSGRDVLVPILPKSTAENLISKLQPLHGKNIGPWQQVSAVAIRRGVIAGVIFALLFGIPVGLFKGWAPAVAGASVFLLLVYVVQKQSFKHLGYRKDEHEFLTRRGWLSRATHIVPTRNIQAIILKQELFDRRYKVASLYVDSAGQAATGGGPGLQNIPVDQAEQVARALAREAAETQYRW